MLLVIYEIRIYLLYVLLFQAGVHDILWLVKYCYICYVACLKWMQLKSRWFYIKMDIRKGFLF